MGHLRDTAARRKSAAKVKGTKGEADQMKAHPETENGPDPTKGRDPGKGPDPEDQDPGKGPDPEDQDPGKGRDLETAGDEAGAEKDRGVEVTAGDTRERRRKRGKDLRAAMTGSRKGAEDLNPRRKEKSPPNESRAKSRRKTKRKK